jgi:hypothetical protein
MPGIRPNPAVVPPQTGGASDRSGAISSDQFESTIVEEQTMRKTVLWCVLAGLLAGGIAMGERRASELRREAGDREARAHEQMQLPALSLREMFPH